MHNICGAIKGEEYTRYPNITTNMLSSFIKQKVDSILEEQGVENTHQVYCFPQVLGETRNGIKYATMAICMNGITDEDDTLYDKIKQFSYRPKINKGIMNSIVRSYEFSEEKLRAFMESPKTLRGLALTVKDIDFLYSKRRLQTYQVHGETYYMFYADMDRILDEFLLNVDEDDPEIPNYVVLKITALGDKPDSPLSYDVMVCEKGTVSTDNSAEVFKALVSKN